MQYSQLAQNSWLFVDVFYDVSLDKGDHVFEYEYAERRHGWETWALGDPITESARRDMIRTDLLEDPQYGYYVTDHVYINVTKGPGDPGGS
jgi:hypothetical protein